jgi:multidrug efflux pump subunit AcrA (membrane-fusion protein)
MLGGCEKTPPATQDEMVRPAPILQLGAAQVDAGLRFPGRVRAVKRADLAFNVPGKIIEFPANEGETLATGDLIAALDPEAFQLELAAARAEYDKTRADYDRVATIWQQSQAVARAEVDQKRTAKAPIRPATAPEAPTSGMSDSG